MLFALLVVVIGLMPSIVSVFVLRRADAQAQARLQRVLESLATRGLSRLSLPDEQHYVEELGYIIGDQSCLFNARSPYVRCAVNPSGPCEDCRHYQNRTGAIVSSLRSEQ
ncbi:MAG: hypothetical protein IGR76_00265 [Synechococcales cyanobacterium T60_A2020_003]|nr:hypothetical protein [Synechococcales cyanobacterium T60_A2020_003]